MNPLARTEPLFLAYLRHECGLASNTIDAYTLDLRRFFAWADEAKVKSWDELGISKLGDYLDYLNNEKLSPSSVARHVASLKTFFRFLVLDGFITTSTAELLHRPSMWERLPYVLSERQVTALLSSPHSNDKLALRDRAILEMMYATGTRASEVASLKVAEVNVDQRYCKCLGKGNKQRIVPFSATAQEILKQYLKRFRPFLVAPILEAGLPDPDFLFLTRGGRAMTRIDIWKLVKKYARRIGVGDRVSPHTLRHSFATHLLSEGLDLRVIQELLGHSSITTTQHYTRVDTARLKGIHSKFHPRA